MIFLPAGKKSKRQFYKDEVTTSKVTNYQFAQYLNYTGTDCFTEINSAQANFSKLSKDAAYKHH